MKITTTITIDVDPKAWAEEFHTPDGHDEIRDDVVKYLTTMMQTVFGDHGTSGLAPAITSVSVRPSCKKSKKS